MKRYLIVALLLVLTSTSNNAIYAQRITVTIAGTGLAGYTGDGKPAKIAKLDSPQFVCSDAAGDIYFVDGSKIRKISSKNGVINTVAGGGTSISDGIPATDALLWPGNICCDLLGNLYVVSGDEVRIVDAVTNVITTYVGRGITGYGGDGGPATAALFSGINGICSDHSGNFYIVDQLNNRIRKIAAGTGVVTTIAGTGVPGYTGDGGPAIAAMIHNPEFVCTNIGGDIFFTDQGTEYIRRIDAVTGVISTYAGGGSHYYTGLALSTLLGTVTGMCIDASDDNVCFNEISCSCRKMNHTNDSVNYIGGDPGTESYRDDTNSLYGWMNNPYGLISDGHGNVYVADEANNRIRKLIKLTHTPTFAYGKGQTIIPCSGYIYTVDSLLWITDIDSAQTETWSVVTPPVNGTLTGFPAASVSNGTHKTVKPVGTSYFAPSTYIGADSFRVRVSDGILSDTITIYVSVHMVGPGSISGVSNVCVGATVTLIDTIAYPGIWSASNSNAIIGSSGTVTGITAGVDTMFYTLTGVCPFAASKIVTINPLPFVGAIVGVSDVCVGASITLTETVPGGIWSSGSIYTTVGSATGVVTGISGGWDNITYTTSNMWCSSDTTMAMTISSLPYSGIILGPRVVCPGAMIMLSDSIPGGAWSATNADATIGSSGIVTGITIGTDSINYTVPFGVGCNGTFVAIVSIMPGTPPDAGIITGPTSVCPGSSITLMDAAGGGVWSASNGNSTISGIGIVTGVSAGSDTIIYTVSNACGSAESTQEITITDCATLGNNTLASAPAISIFPNPASSVLNIEGTAIQGNVNVTITDVSGRLVLSTELANGQVNISELKDGIYLVAITTSTEHFTDKLVVSK